MKRTEKLSFRLVIQLIVVVTIITTITSVVVFQQVRSDAEQMAERSLSSTLSSVKKLINIYNTELKSEAENLSAIFAKLFPGEFSIDTNQSENIVNERVPVISSGGQVIAGNYTQVDQFADATGGNATIFVRSGNDFVRVVTSVIKEDGSRAVGTKLSQSSPAYPVVMRGETFFGKVTLFGRKFVTEYYPIKDDRGQVIGIRYIGIGFEDSLSELREGIATEIVGKEGFLLVIDNSAGDANGTLLVHPSNEGQKVQSLGGNSVVAFEQMKREGSGQLIMESSQEIGLEWFLAFETIEQLDWILIGAIPQAEISASANSIMKHMSVSGVVTILLLILLISFIVNRQVAKPLEAAVKEIEILAGGDYTQAISVNRKGEIGLVQKALFSMQKDVGGVLSNVDLLAHDLLTACEKMTESSTQVADSSTNQTESASSMSAAIEELTVSIEQLSGHAREASQISEQANQQAKEGSEVIYQADRQMHEIADSVNKAAGKIDQLGQLSEDITSIIQVIENIAEQTNLLALNAAIEAARAGEQGRGFAVVADEVRNLASRTTESAHEITTMIEKMNTNTKESVSMMGENQKDVSEIAGLANEAGQAIESISQGSQRVVQVFSEISYGLNEQAVASTEVAKNVEQIVEKTHVNNEAIAEVAKHSYRLKVQAAALRQGLAGFVIERDPRVNPLQPQDMVEKVASVNEFVAQSDVKKSETWRRSESYAYDV